MSYALPEFANKKIIFIGKGREGENFKHFIDENIPLADFRFVDQSDGPDYLEKLKELDLNETIVVKTAGCPGGLVPVPYTTPTKVFFSIVKNTPAKIVGVTGTKGKTTTASLIAAMLQFGHEDVRLCGNIGIPMLSALDIRVTEKTIFVVELSSYQLTELTMSPDIAVVTNLYNDHIDYHGSLEAYWNAKKHIMKYQDVHGVYIYNNFITELCNWATEAKGQAIGIAPKPTQYDPLAYIDIKRSSLFGDHNLANARLAAAVAKEFDMFSEDIQHVIEKFVPVRHRLQVVAKKNGITYIDDAIASHPEAAIAAIEAVTNYIGPVGCMFLGGLNREYDFKELAKAIVTRGINRFVLFPDTGLKIFEEIKNLNPPYEIKAHQTYLMEDAVKWASENTPPETVALLSCGSPSYSLWKDFEEKGDQFQNAVEAL